MHELPRTCKAALLVEYGKPLEIHEVPIPQIEPRAILVKVEMAGICGTDIHQHHGTLTIKSPLPSISAAIQHFYKALQFIKNKRNKYPFADIVSRKYQLEEINEAFDNMAAGKDIKPVIDNRNR
jgi:Zn-dependent alcohol dehydrogenase